MNFNIQVTVDGIETTLLALLEARRELGPDFIRAIIFREQMGDTPIQWKPFKKVNHEYYGGEDGDVQGEVYDFPLSASVRVW